MKRRNSVLTLLLVLAIAIAFVAPCFGGGDADFHAVVRTIELQYGIHHIRIPFGLATFCLKVAQVPGASGLKIAVFDHLGDRSGDHLGHPDGIANGELEQSIESSIGNTWHPLVRVRSNGDGELTLVYTNPSDKDLHALIVCIESDTATVVQAKVTIAQIRKWIEQPDEVTHQID
jgi:hypothetical protein